MRNKTNAGSILIFFIIAILAGSCKKNCSSVVCHVYETCNNGICFCPNGWEGDSCKTSSATKFLNKTFLVSDGCSGNGSYYVTFTSIDPNYPGRLSINNFFGLGQSVEADILSSADKKGINLSIPQQSFGIYDFNGQGLYETYGGGSKITINMDVIQNSIEKNCTITLYQQ